MPTQKKPWDFLSNDEKRYAIDQIITFFAEERDEEIGRIAAEEVLDMFLELLGPQVYNSALEDAKIWLKEKFTTIEVDYDLLKK